MCWPRANRTAVWAGLSHCRYNRSIRARHLILNSRYERSPCRTLKEHKYTWRMDWCTNAFAQHEHCLIFTSAPQSALITSCWPMLSTSRAMVPQSHFAHITLAAYHVPSCASHLLLSQVVHELSFASLLRGVRAGD